MSFRHAFLSSILVVALASITNIQAADIEIEENPVPVNSFGVARYKLEKGEAIIWTISPRPTKFKQYTEGDYSYVNFLGVTSKYSIEAIIVNFDTRKIERKVLDNVEVKGCAIGPIPPPEDKDPPGQPTGKYYFLVVRPDGPTHPDFTKIMSSPAWDGLRSQGHKVGSATLSETKNLRINLDGAVLPSVVTIQVSADGKSSTQVRGPIPLPTTPADIAELPNLK